MAQGMKSTYCKGSSGTVCRSFTDGSSVCLCTKGWNVFFATLNEHKWSDTSPRPKSVSETMIEDAIEETVQNIVDWFDETKKHTKRKRLKKNVPVHRFEARTHHDAPKGKKILKPNPIHIMPTHMQTEEDKDE